MGETGETGTATGFESLFNGGQENSYAQGDCIFALGSVPDRVYLVRSGRVRVSRLSTDGRELTLAVLGPGEILGEVALLDGGERTAEAVALTETTLVSLTNALFLRALGNHPQCTLQLMHSLCRRLRQADQLVEDLTFLGVKERLQNLLSRLGGEQSVESGTLTHQELAEMIGTSRESVTRALAELRRDFSRTAV